MQTLDWLNKDKTLPTSDPRRLWREEDIDELQAKFNANVSEYVSDLSGINSALAARLILANVIFNEVPTGTINGVNGTFTIANAVQGTLIMVFSDGLCINPDGFDLTGTTLVLSIPPDNSLTVTYIKA